MVSVARGGDGVPVRHLPHAGIGHGHMGADRRGVPFAFVKRPVAKQLFVASVWQCIHVIRDFCRPHNMRPEADVPERVDKSTTRTAGVKPAELQICIAILRDLSEKDYPDGAAVLFDAVGNASPMPPCGFGGKSIQF